MSFYILINTKPQYCHQIDFLCSSCVKLGQGAVYVTQPSAQNPNDSPQVKSSFAMRFVLIFQKPLTKEDQMEQMKKFYLE